MERKIARPTVADVATADLGGPRTMAFLDRCERLIDWQSLIDAVKPLFPEQHHARDRCAAYTRNHGTRCAAGTRPTSPPTCGA